MAWLRRRTRRPAAPPPEALTAAAKQISAGTERVTPSLSQWQQEAWGMYEKLGEFSYAVDWRAAMTSRVRLRAARVDPGQDEPVITDEGEPAELVGLLFGGPGGVAEALETISVHLGVPGESWVVAEQRDGAEWYRVCSTDEIRPRGQVLEVLDEDNLFGGDKWRALGKESLTSRVWEPDKRKRTMPTSTGRKALTVMRELELVNRKIIAEYLSRLASAGLLVIPSEVQLPVRPEFAGSPDGFAREFLAVASEAIATPGSAAAAVPVPMFVPAEYAELIRHIDFTLDSDEKLLEKRDSAIRRLATRLNVPAEILLGMGAANHWSGWLIDEQALKTHIVPHVETICHGLTVGYLWPRLKAAGVTDYWRWVVWYDASEITQRPDLSEGATLAYDRLELSGEAYRRQLGFDEADKPTAQEQEEQALRILIRAGGASSLDALAALTGTPRPVTEPAPAPVGQDPPADPAADPPADERRNQGPPEGGDRPAQDPAAAVVAAAIAQARTRHRITVHPVTGQWSAVHHPQACRDRLFSCPVTHAAANHRGVMPGVPGDYECWLSPWGSLMVGARVYDRAGYIESTYRRSNGKVMANGASHR